MKTGCGTSNPPTPWTLRAGYGAVSASTIPGTTSGDRSETAENTCIARAQDTSPRARAATIGRACSGSPTTMARRTCAARAPMPVANAISSSSPACTSARCSLPARVAPPDSPGSTDAGATTSPDASSRARTSRSVNDTARAASQAVSRSRFSISARSSSSDRPSNTSAGISRPTPHCGGGVRTATGPRSAATMTLYPLAHRFDPSSLTSSILPNQWTPHQCSTGLSRTRLRCDGDPCHRPVSDTDVHRDIDAQAESCSMTTRAIS